MSKPPKDNHYIDSERMCELASESAASGDFSDELVSMFYVLAQRRCSRFSESIDKGILGVLDADDIVQEAVMLCVTKTEQFDPTRLKHTDNAFYFFRMVVDQCFIRLYEHAHRQKRKPDLPIYSLDHQCDWLEATLMGEESQELQDDLRDAYGAVDGHSASESLYRSLAQDSGTDSSDLILDIIQQHEDGMSYAELAKEYSISEEIIEELILRKES